MKIKNFLLRQFPGLYKKAARLKTQLKLSRKTREELFTDYYQANTWGDHESRSGPGFRLDRTEHLRSALPQLVKDFNCVSVLDIPCGDFNWMKLVEWDVDYTGADIVKDMIHQNQVLYGNDRRRFLTLDVTRDPLPRVDLVICRDCLVHFSYDDIFETFNNLRNSGSTYLLTTTLNKRENNKNIVTGEWRPLNLQKPPFNLPAPLVFIEDTFPNPNYFDKYMGLWKISDLPHK